MGSALESYWKLSLVYFGNLPCASRAVIITVICCSYLSNFVLLSVMLWYSRPKGIDWKGLGGFWAKLVIWQLKITLSNQYWRGAHHVKKRAAPWRGTPGVGRKPSLYYDVDLGLYLWDITYNNAMTFMYTLGLRKIFLKNSCKSFALEQIEVISVKSLLL